MGTLLTTELSAKRQITLPESICEALSLQTGSQFIILVQNDTLILKNIITPDLNKLLEYTQQQAKTLGIKPQDIETAISQVRQK